jgi:hypothetical protein
MPSGTIIGPAKEIPVGTESAAAPGGVGSGGRGIGMTGAGPLFEARLPMLLPNLTEKSNDKIKWLWIAVGVNDGLLGVNRQTKIYLDSRGIKNTYTEYPNYGHEWPLWRINLVEFAQRIFK